MRYDYSFSILILTLAVVFPLSLLAADLVKFTGHDPIALSGADSSDYLSGGAKTLSNIAYTIYQRAQDVCAQFGLNLVVSSYQLKESEFPDDSGNYDIHFQDLWCLRVDPDPDDMPNHLEKITHAMVEFYELSGNSKHEKCWSQPNDQPYKKRDDILHHADLSRFFLEENREKTWVDLFKSDAYFQVNQILKTQIDEYHQISKTDPAFFFERIKKLAEIQSLADHELKSSSSVQAQLISQTAKNKRQYLLGLQELPLEIRRHHFALPARDGQPQTGMDPQSKNRLERLREYLKLPQQSRRGGSPLLSYPTYASEFVSHLDPAHRANIGRRFDAYLLSQLKLSHPTYSQREEQILPFYYWLEGQNDTGQESDLMSSTYRHPEKRRVIFSPQGQAMIEEPIEGVSSTPAASVFPELKQNPALYPHLSTDSDLYLIPNSDGHGYEYNIDAQGDLYINLNAGKHSTVNLGKQAMAAGFVDFQEGKLSYLDQNSGHYRPSESNVKTAVEKLKLKYGENIFDKSFKLNLGYEREKIGRPLDLEEILSWDQNPREGQKPQLSIRNMWTTEEISIKDFIKKFQNLPVPTGEQREEYYVGLLKEDTQLKESLKSSQPPIHLSQASEARVVQAALAEFLDKTRVVRKAIDDVRVAIELYLKNPQGEGAELTNGIRGAMKAQFILNQFADSYRAVESLQGRPRVTLQMVFEAMSAIREWMGSSSSSASAVHNELEKVLNNQGTAWPLNQALRRFSSPFDFGGVKIPFDERNLEPNLRSSGLSLAPYHLSTLLKMTHLKTEDVQVQYDGKDMSVATFESEVKKQVDRQAELQKLLKPYSSMGNFQIIQSF